MLKSYFCRFYSQKGTTLFFNLKNITQISEKNFVFCLFLYLTYTLHETIHRVKVAFYILYLVFVI